MLARLHLADTYLPTDAGLIPTGEIRPVADTPFDFRKPKAVGRDIAAENEDLRLAGGYDHCFNFVGGETKEPLCRAVLFDPASGREMKVLTNQPCVQCYTANFLCNQEHPFKGGYPQAVHHAFCLETERMPDSMNHPGFTACTINPDAPYTHHTIYRFFAK